MKNEPDIVKELREAEKIGLLQNMIPTNIKELEMVDEPTEKTSEQASHIVKDWNTGTNEHEMIGFEEKYKTIFENYAIAIILADNKERIVSWNKYTEKLLNMSQSDLYLRSVKLLYPPDEWKKIRAENVRQKGIKYRMETRMIRKNEGSFDVELSLCILRGKEGKTVGSVGIIKDITKLKETERELKKSEERYRTIFENSAVAITLTDENERIISWNKCTEDLLGFSKEDLHLKPVKSLYPPEEWQNIRTKNIRKKGLQHHLETKMVKKNNEIIDVNLSLSVLKNHDGKVIGSIGVTRDITEHKQIERSLEKSEEKFKQLYERAPLPYHTLSPDGIITDVNKKWCQALGYSKENILGKSIFDFIIENEREDAKSSFEKKIQDKKAYTGGHERKYITKDEKEKIFVIHDFFSYDKDNKVASIQTIMEDITERKQAEELLKKSEDKFRNLAEYSPNMIFINKKGKVVYANKKCEEVMGYKREEFYSPDFDFMNLIAPESKDMIKTSFNLHMNGEEIDPYEYKLISKDGKKIEALITTKLINYEEDNAILGIVTNIAKQKKTEEELREAHKQVANLNKELEQRVQARTSQVQKLLKQKDEFIQQLGHDLKNPLTPLVGLMPLLEKADKNPKSQKLFEILHRNIDCLKNIVFRILELAELNTPDITKLILEDINLREEAENSLKDIKLIYNNKGFNIENKIDENIYVKADKIRLCEVFNNLIVNAVKYSQYGNSVTLDAFEDGEFVTVSILDSGIGMTEEQIRYIFDEFYKADESRHDSYSTGLGLPICKSIVEKHGGKIWAESSGLGKGSTFYFTVPIGSKKSKDNVLEENK